MSEMAKPDSLLIQQKWAVNSPFLVIHARHPASRHTSVRYILRVQERKP